MPCAPALGGWGHKGRPALGNLPLWSSAGPIKEPVFFGFMGNFLFVCFSLCLFCLSDCFIFVLFPEK